MRIVFRFRRLLFLGLILCGVTVIFCSRPDADKIPVTTSSKEALAEFLKGRNLFEKLRGQESLQFFDRAVEKDPAFAMAHLFASFSQPTIKGFFDRQNQALMFKEKVSEGERLWIEGVKAGTDGFPRKQIEIYQKLVSLYPRDERAHNLLGNSYFGLQEYDNAIAEYRQATAINPEFSQSYNQMGYAYRFLENYDEAEQAFKKYIELIPDDPNPYDSYAELLMKTGRYDESIAQYQKALEINPNFVASHIGIATNLNFKNQHENARQQLQKLFGIARNDGERRAARFAMTVSYVDEGNLDQALKELEWQYQLGEQGNDSPNMAGDLILMGNILYEQGKYDQALDNYKNAMKIIETSDLGPQVKENGRRNFLYNQARVMVMKKDLAQARRLSDDFMQQATAVKNTFQIWLGHELQGMIAMSEKKYDQALSEFQQSNLQNPYNLFRLAQAFQAAGDREKALEYYARAAGHNTLNNMQYAFIRHTAAELLAQL